MCGTYSRLTLSEDKEERRKQLIDIEENVGVIIKIKNNIAFAAKYKK